MDIKIKFRDLFILSEILDKVEIKSYFEYIERKLTKIEKEFKADFNCELAEEDLKQLSEKKKITAVGDVAAFIATKLYKVENEIVRLFKKVCKMTDDEIDNLSISDTIEILKEMFNQGLPEIVKNKMDDTLKKTL
jgi:phosphomevalonate kinase